jgi:3-phenylpropionate/cinnamic acid dioxygenase small subunit
MSSSCPAARTCCAGKPHRELTPLGDLAILKEDKRYLEMRVARLDTGMAWAENPPSRSRHLIGNLEAAPVENGKVEAKTDLKEPMAGRLAPCPRRDEVS